MKTMQIGSLAELPDAAEEIIRSLGGRTIVAFRGEMGAGKTTLIREIAARLGSDDVVTSPTFAIINQYAAAEGRTLYHFPIRHRPLLPQSCRFSWRYGSGCG